MYAANGLFPGAEIIPVPPYREGPSMPSRVLIVEDQFLIALDLQDTLEDDGHEVVGIAGDAVSAMALAERAEVALVDLNLSDGPTGIDIGRRLAKEFDVTVVYLTGNPEQLGKGVDGTIGVLRKPCSPETVLTVLDFVRHDADRRTRMKTPDRLTLFT